MRILFLKEPGTAFQKHVFGSKWDPFSTTELLPKTGFWEVT